MFFPNHHHPSPFKGQFGNYQVQITGDGSPTFWSEDFGESGHSSVGAYLETDLYYVQGCQVAQRGESVPLFPLLEIGFGTGIGYERTIRELFLSAPSTRLLYVGLERDESLLQWGMENLRSDVQQTSLYPEREKLRPTTFWGMKAFSAETPSGTLVVLVGDARESIRRLQEGGPPPFLAIYQDAFSPLKNPTLWTVEWFTSLKTLSDSDCLLSSFSASSRFRKALMEAGWAVHEGPKFPPKRASTLAKAHGPSSPSLIERLSRSPVAALTDDNTKSLLV